MYVPTKIGHSVSAQSGPGVTDTVIVPLSPNSAVADSRTLVRKTCYFSSRVSSLRGLIRVAL